MNKTVFWIFWMNFENFLIKVVYIHTYTVTTKLVIQLSQFNWEAAAVWDAETNFAIDENIIRSDRACCTIEQLIPSIPHSSSIPSLLYLTMPLGCIIPLPPSPWMMTLRVELWRENLPSLAYFYTYKNGYTCMYKYDALNNQILCDIVKQLIFIVSLLNLLIISSYTKSLVIYTKQKKKHFKW